MRHDNHVRGECVIVEVDRGGGSADLECEGESVKFGCGNCVRGRILVAKARETDNCSVGHFDNEDASIEWRCLRFNEIIVSYVVWRDVAIYWSDVELRGGCVHIAPVGGSCIDRQTQKSNVLLCNIRKIVRVAIRIKWHNEVTVVG